MNITDPAIAFARFFQSVALGMVGLLVLALVLELFAWCWDRWCRRGCDTGEEIT